MESRKLIMAGLIAAVLVCNLSVSLAQNARPGDDLKGQLLYEENFSTSKGSLWAGSSDDNWTYYFDNGRYKMVVYRMNSWKSYATRNNYSNFIMDVQARQEGGTNDNVYGAIIRKVDWNNYYNFLISGDGYYQIAIRENGKWSPASWKRSDAINMGNATNLIRVICNDDAFSFYVNDVLLEEYKDSSFSSGNIGLTAGTNYAIGSAKVSFDNLTIWQIKNS
ncbi:MAG: hypothetical protein WCW68_09915 [Methanothrix sp.]